MIMVKWSKLSFRTVQVQVYKAASISWQWHSSVHPQSSAIKRFGFYDLSNLDKLEYDPLQAARTTKIIVKFWKQPIFSVIVSFAYVDWLVLIWDCFIPSWKSSVSLFFLHVHIVIFQKDMTQCFLKIRFLILLIIIKIYLHTLQK